MRTLNEWLKISWPHGIGERERSLSRIASSLRSRGWDVTPLQLTGGEPHVRATLGERSLRLSITPIDRMVAVYRNGHPVPHLYDSVPDFLERLDADFSVPPASGAQSASLEAGAPEELSA